MPTSPSTALNNAAALIWRRLRLPRGEVVIPRRADQPGGELDQELRLLMSLAGPAAGSATAGSRRLGRRPGHRRGRCGLAGRRHAGAAETWELRSELPGGGRRLDGAAAGRPAARGGQLRGRPRSALAGTRRGRVGGSRCCKGPCRRAVCWRCWGIVPVASSPSAVAWRRLSAPSSTAPPANTAGSTYSNVRSTIRRPSSSPGLSTRGLPDASSPCVSIPPCSHPRASIRPPRCWLTTCRTRTAAGSTSAAARAS